MILPAQTIRALGIVFPFHERTVHRGMTFGLGPAGYDVRLDQDVHIKPGQFKLASTFEQVFMPPDVLGYVKDKSTFARRGLSLFNTVLEPGWEGYVTLELAHHGDTDLIIESGAPIAQIVFHRLEAPTETPYRGRYQNQERGPQPARRARETDR